MPSGFVSAGCGGAAAAGSAGGSAKVNLAVHRYSPQRSDSIPAVSAVGTTAAESVGEAVAATAVVSGISHAPLAGAVPSFAGLPASSDQLAPSRASHSSKRCGPPRLSSKNFTRVVPVGVFDAPGAVTSRPPMRNRGEAQSSPMRTRASRELPESSSRCAASSAPSAGGNATATLRAMVMVNCERTRPSLLPGCWAAAGAASPTPTTTARTPRPNVRMDYDD